MIKGFSFNNYEYFASSDDCDNNDGHESGPVENIQGLVYTGMSYEVRILDGTIKRGIGTIKLIGNRKNCLKQVNGNYSLLNKIIKLNIDTNDKNINDKFNNQIFKVTKIETRTDPSYAFYLVPTEIDIEEFEPVSFNSKEKVLYVSNQPTNYTTATWSVVSTSRNIGKMGPRGNRGPRGQVGNPGVRGKRSGEKGPSGIGIKNAEIENGELVLHVGRENNDVLEKIYVEGSLLGEKGDKGAKGESIIGSPGEPGQQGPPGVMGDPGNLGLPGPIGAPGEPGLSGNPGSNGQKGVTGVPGQQGPQGPPGGEGFQNMNINNGNNLLIVILLFGCIFYLLNHKNTYKILNLKVDTNSSLLIFTLIFFIISYILHITLI